MIGVCIATRPGVVLALLFCLGRGPYCYASNWPGWRGPNGDGVSTETNLPVKWSATKGIRWKVELPGKGISTPVIWENRLFVTSSSGAYHNELHVLCLDRRDGSTLWHQRFEGTTAAGFVQARTSMANPTPVTDGKLVWVFFGTGDFYCLDMRGNLLWNRALVREYERFQNRFGMSSSPVLVGGMVILQCDHRGRSYLIAMNGHTGENVWKTHRAEHLSWTTPLVTLVGGRRELIVCGTYQVKGYDPSTGHELWVARGLKRDTVPTAVAGDGLVFAVSGHGGATLAIRAGGLGDITDTHIVWKSRRGSPFIPSPLLLDGLYYMIHDKGVATCLHAKTGKLAWRKRLGHSFTASPVAGDGKLYFIGENGTVTVMAADTRGRVLSRNRLGEPVFSSPAIAYGDIFVRGAQHLFCIRGVDRP